MISTKSLSIPFLLLAFTGCSTEVKQDMTPAELGHETIDKQRDELARNTAQKGFGPQSPRDIDNIKGSNPIVFSEAPAYEKMNLCNIHFHKYAEHKGGEFTKFAGPGDGQGKS